MLGTRTTTLVLLTRMAPVFRFPDWCVLACFFLEKSSMDQGRRRQDPAWDRFPRKFLPGTGTSSGSGSGRARSRRLIANAPLAKLDNTDCGRVSRAPLAASLSRPTSVEGCQTLQAIMKTAVQQDGAQYGVTGQREPWAGTSRQAGRRRHGGQTVTVTSSFVCSVTLTFHQESPARALLSRENTSSKR